MPPEQEPLSRGWWVSKHPSLQKLSAQRKETDSRCQNVCQNGFGDCKRFDVYQVRYNFLRAIQMLDNAQASCIIHRATSRALDEDKIARPCPASSSPPSDGCCLRTCQPSHCQALVSGIWHAEGKTRPLLSITCSTQVPTHITPELLRSAQCNSPFYPAQTEVAVSGVRGRKPCDVQ